MTVNVLPLHADGKTMGRFAYNRPR